MTVSAVVSFALVSNRTPVGREAAATSSSLTIPSYLPTSIPPATTPTSGPSSAVSTTVPSTLGAPPTASQIVASNDTSTYTLTPTPVPTASSIPSTPCTDADLSANVYVDGVLASMSFVQDVVTISSQTDCSLSGYPVLQFSGSSGPVEVSVTDGGTSAVQVPSPTPVAVGPGTPVSFLIQFQPGDTASCVIASSLEIGVSGTTPSVGVTLADVPGFQTAWNLCGSQASVTPFEQGASLSQYT